MTPERIEELQSELFKFCQHCNTRSGFFGDCNYCDKVKELADLAKSAHKEWAQEGIERAAKLCEEMFNEKKKIVDSLSKRVLDKNEQQTLERFRDSLPCFATMRREILALQPDPHHSARIWNEAIDACKKMSSDYLDKMMNDPEFKPTGKFLDEFYKLRKPIA